MCFKIYFIFVHVCVHMCVQVHTYTWVCARMSILGVCAHDCRCLRRPEDGIRFPGAEVAGNFELPNGESIGNCPLEGQSFLSYTLSHRSGPSKIYLP